MPVLLDRRASLPLLIAVLSLAPWAALSGSSPGGQASAVAQPLTVMARRGTDVLRVVVSLPAKVE